MSEKTFTIPVPNQPVRLLAILAGFFSSFFMVTEATEAAKDLFKASALHESEQADLYYQRGIEHAGDTIPHFIALLIITTLLATVLRKKPA